MRTQYSKVFRSYDSRFRCTDRRPDLYFEPSTFKEDTGPIAEIVLEITDKNFSEPPNKEDRIDWLWRYQGKLLVISTPYHEGQHYATRPLHFLPIIEHLQQLHCNFSVHGDIRAYNMVLKYADPSSKTDQAATSTSTGNNATNANNIKGWLIDFDFGGRHNDVCYPEGYKPLLYDGDRPGIEGNKITIMDDWKSLIGMIFHVYSFVAKKEVAELTLEQKDSLIRRKRAELESYRDMEFDSSNPLLGDYEKPAKLLREYIDLTSDIYDLIPQSKFRLDMTKCGFCTTKKLSKASEAATGSPQKKI